MLKRLDLSFSGIIFTIALLWLAIQLGIGLLQYSNNAVDAIKFPYPMDYGEGPVLDQVLRLSHFENIYRKDISTPPFNISNYPPIFHLLQVPFAWLFGPAYWYGRLLSLASAILAALMIGLTLNTLIGDRTAAIIAGLMLFAFPYILRWSSLDRVDTLALALSWAGLFAIVRWPDRRRGVVLGVILFTVAIFTKQTYGLVGPGTALAWLLQSRRWQQALRLAGWLAGVCAVLFFGLNWITGGGFFFNIITANLNGISQTNVMRVGTDFFVNSWILILATAGFLVVERWWYPTRSWPLVLPYVLLSAAILPLAGKEGSDINYLYEPAAALCLSAGAVISWPRRNYWLKTAVLLFLILQINIFVNASRAEYIPLTESRVNAVDEIARLERIVQDAPGPVLSDEYMGLMPLNSRSTYYQPFEYGQLLKSNLWKPAEFIASIEAREFPAIILYEPAAGSPLIVTRWPLPIRKAIWANYVLKTTLAGNWVYFPRP